MVLTLSTVLLVIAIVCFLFAAFSVQTGRVAIGWIGLAFFAAAFLFH